MAKDLLTPVEFLTPEFIEWTNRHSRALDAQLHDTEDPAGLIAIRLVNEMWPHVEELHEHRIVLFVADEGDEDGIVSARRRFERAVMEWVDDNVGILMFGAPDTLEEG